MTTPGFRVDQIAPAILNAPGATVEMLRKVPGGNYNTASGSFVTINAAMNGSFTIPVSGTYLVSFTVQAYAISSAVHAIYRLNIDSGAIIIGTDDSSWKQHLNTTSHEGRTFVGTVTLAAGYHTISPEWRIAVGGGSAQIDTNDSIVVQGTLVSGSGAGGVLVTEAVDAADRSGTNATPVEVTQLALTITTSANEWIQLAFSGCVDYGPSGSAGTPALFYQIDSAGWVPMWLQSNTANYANDGAVNRWLQVAAAGAHIIHFGICANQGGSSNYWRLYGTGTGSLPSRFQCIQYRGGLVPINKDGTEVLTAPRALNFIGSGVSVNANTGAADIQLNEVLTAPGTEIIVTGTQPVNNINVSESTYTQVMPEAGSLSFTAPTAGTYLVKYDPTYLISSSASYVTATSKLVFDEGTSSEQSIGDNSGWRHRYGQYEYFGGSFVAAVTLTAGSHTLKGYAKEYAAGTLIVQGSSTVIVGDATVSLTLVSGSGAGGTLITSKTLSGNHTNITSATWIAVRDGGSGADLAATIATSAGEYVVLGGLVKWWQITAEMEWDVGIGLDGADPVDPYITRNNTDGNWTGATAVYPSPYGPLTAGSHTLRVMVRRANGTGVLNIAGVSPTFTTFSVIQYRGGLVPIRDDGAVVIDTPAAIDFVGPNVQVTNVGGTAKVAYNGVAEGALVTRTSDSGGSVQTISSTDPSFTDITGMSLTITAIAGESVNVQGEVGVLHDSGVGVASLRLLLDDATVIWTDRSYSDSWTDIAIGCASPALTVGSHTVKLQAAKGTNNFKVYGPGAASSVLTRMQITQHRGGYVQPENIPILEYLSAGVIYVKAGPGASSNLRLLMNDGVRYQAASPLTLSLATTGLGGLDTGTEAVSTWYYVYAVPSTTYGCFGVVASITPPTSGPTGYSVWRYLGAIYNDASGNIQKFHQVGNEFTIPNIGTAIGGGAVDASPVLLSLSALIPVTASMWIGSAYVHAVTSTSTQLRIYADGNTGIGHTLLAYARQTNDTSQVDGRVPTPTTPKVIYYQRVTGTGTPDQASVATYGWIDGHLSGLPSQLQAQYQPDTALPQLTWAANSQVTVAAAPGQSTTIKTTLQDGVQRSFVGTLTWDPSTGAADGGLDTGTEANSTWYYLYLVPRYGADQMLHVRGSVSPPSTGPSGYANHKYLGAAYNNGSGNILTFQQNGSIFLRELSTIVAEAPTTGTSEAAPGTLLGDLVSNGHVPATAGKVLVTAWIGQGGDADQWVLQLRDNSAGTMLVCHNQSYDGAANTWGEVPLPISTKKFYRRIYRASGSAANADYYAIYCNGWVDPYVGGAVTGTALQGAQGAVKTSATDAVDRTGSGASIAEVTQLALAVTAVQGEVLCVTFTGLLDYSSGPMSPVAYYQVDSGGWNAMVCNTAAGASYATNACFIAWPTVSAGSHTIKFGFKEYGGGSWRLRGSLINPSISTCVQFRGGYVAVQKDGAEVINTPQAYNFVGPNVQVTNVGSKANITYNGVAEGTEAAESYLTGDYVCTGSYADTGLSVSVTTNASERVLCLLTGYAMSAGGTSSIVLRFVVDGSPIDPEIAMTAGNSGYGVGCDFSRFSDSLSAGPHTIKVQAWYAGGSGMTLKAPARFQVVRVKGGYVQPENIPILEYSSASVVNVKAGSGAASTLWLLLNDGVRYQAVGTLTVNLTVSGRGGLDSGTEASSTWYYVYAVPSLTSGYFSVLCSVSAPSTGPTGYPIWRYLGAFRNDGSSNILKFYQTGTEFRFAARTQVYNQTSNEGSPVSVSLSSYIPATSDQIIGYAYTRTAGSGGDIHQYLWADGDSGGTEMYDVYSGIAWEGNGSEIRIPTKTSPKAIYRRIYIASGTCQDGRFYVDGWVDAYLQNLASQLQARYSPDTALPQLTYSSVSAINVAAAPGQNATVALTLQDGKQRTFTGTLAWSFTNGVADLGLDTGAEASSTWYYMYAVPKSGADDFLTVRASVTGPATGPTGYSNWKYLGAFRNNGSGNILKFYQDGSGYGFSYAVPTVPLDFTGAGGADGAIQTCTLTDHVPATAVQADVLGYFQAATGTTGTMFLFSYGDEDISTATTRWNTAKLKCSAPNAAGGQSHRGLISIPASTKRFTYIRDAYNNSRLECQGWIDAYLLPPQAAGSGAPGLHAAAHQNGGSDEVATGTPAANAIPKADGSGKLDGWVTADAVASTSSLRKLGTGSTDACAGNDGRLSDNRTPTAHDLAGSAHNSDTLANLNGKISDANLGTPVTASASGPVSLTANDSGNVYTNEGALAEVEFTLPTAAASLNFTFIVQDVDGVKVTAATGDTIRIAGDVTPTAGNITAATIGNVVLLVAINATEWMAVQYVGTWTVST